MDPWAPLQVVAGGVLLFFLPGYAVTRAVFPERRLRGPGRLRTAVETVTLAFVLSVVFTVLAGYLLLTLAPGGFAASWSSPILEATLAGVTAVAFVVGLLEGAYGSKPVPTRADQEATREEGAWEVFVALDRLAVEQRRLKARKRLARDPETVAAVDAELEANAENQRDIGRRREADLEL